MRANPSFMERYRFLDLRLPRLYAAFLFTCLVCFIAVFSWTRFAEMDIVIRASAVIRPIENVSVLKNASAGTVTMKTFGQGDAVDRGDSLWNIDTTAMVVERTNVDAQLRRSHADLAVLTHYATSLEVGENRVPPSSYEAYNRAEAYFRDLKKAELQYMAKKEKWNLEKALPPSLSLSQTVNELEQEWRLGVLEFQSMQAREKERTYAERKRLMERIELGTQRRADLEKAISEAEVRAPISGIIEDIKKYNVGDFLVAGEDIARIVPTESVELRLDIRVDPRDIAEIRVGQAINVLFNGLPPSRYGKISGEITHVSADSTMLNGQLSYFLVEATLDKAWVEDQGRHRIRLRPGMVASCRIITSRKNVLRYLLEKLEFINP